MRAVEKNVRHSITSLLKLVTVLITIPVLVCLYESRAVHGFPAIVSFHLSNSYLMYLEFSTILLSYFYICII